MDFHKLEKTVTVRGLRSGLNGHPVRHWPLGISISLAHYFLKFFNGLPPHAQIHAMSDHTGFAII